MSSSGLVTLVFTDLVGSTELAESIGDRAADDLRREHFAALRGAITDTGGVEVKTIGDAMMASYTTASDAIEGSVAMQQAVARANGAAPGPVLSMRIGLSAGDASFEDGDWFGRPVVEAARLCAAADGGQILAADLVRVLAGNRCDHSIESRGVLELKGLPEPLAVCEIGWTPTTTVTAEVPAPPPLPDALSRATGDGFGFVARQEEFERLELAWKDVVTGNRRMVFVTGEPGVGKTRLTSELAQLAHGQGGIVLWGGCDEDLGIPYQPLAESIGHYVHAVPLDALRSVLGPLGGELTRLLPELGNLVPGLDASENGDAEAERRRLAEAVGDLLATVSAAHPVLLVLDDLHWAGKPTLVLLRHLLRATRPMRLLVVGTYRDTDLDRRHPLSEMLADLRRSGEVDRIALAGLGPDGVQSLMESAAGHELDDEPGRQLAIAVHRETEGNPFFVREVLFHLVESGALVHRDGRWTSDVQPDQMAIPEGVREVIGRRLSRLPDATNELLAIASVVGREFDLSLLGALHEGGREAVLDDLEPAERASIVRPATGRPGAYLFGHALVRSTLYEELSTSRRLRLHREAGRALEARGDVDRHLSELARHFGEAAALGEVERAVDYGRRAGDRAAGDLAFEEAAAYYERALGALDVADEDDPAVRCDLLTALGSALVHAADPAHRAVLVKAIELARRLEDPDRLADAVLALGYQMQSRNVNRLDEEHLRYVEEALDRLPPADSERRAGLLADLGGTLMWTPQADRRRQASDDALAMARRIGDPRVTAEVLGQRGVILDTANPDSVDTYIDELSEMITLAEGTSDALHCGGRLQRSMAHLIVGERAASDVDLAVGRDLAQRLREPALVLRSKLLDNAVSLLSGRLADAEAGIFEYLGYAEAHGPELLETAVVAAGSQFFRLRYEQGRLGELLDTILERVENSPEVPAWRIALASVYQQSDEPELAREHVRLLAADDFAMVPRDGLWILTIAGVARMSATLGELDIAARSYELGSSFTGRLAFAGNSMEQPIDLSVGVAARALGRLDAAEAHFRAAIDVSERAGAPTFVAVSRYEWAALLLDRDGPGDRERGVELAGQALATAEELGLGRIQRLATDLLA